MKKIFKKTMATVAAMSMVLAGSALNVSAAGDTAELNIKDGVSAKPGATVAVEIYVKGDTTLSVDSVAMIVDYDKALGLVEKDVVTSPAGVNQKITDGSMYLSYNSSTPIALKDKTVIATLNFTVPEDAIAGTEYKISWNENKFKFRNTQVSVANDLALTRDSDGSVGGSIIVEGATTTPTTPATTAAATSPTAAATSPTAAATSPAATSAATTAAATTTTKATTTTNVSTGTDKNGTNVSTGTDKTGTNVSTGTDKTGTKVTSSPKTGSSSTGIAALAATMIVAAGTAVVLKKKKD